MTHSTPNAPAIWRHASSSRSVRQAGKWGLPKATVAGIFTGYYDRLHQICSGFRREGIVHLSTSHFIPVTDFADQLDAVAKEIRDVASELTAAPREE